MEISSHRYIHNVGIKQKKPKRKLPIFLFGVSLVYCAYALLAPLPQLTYSLDEISIKTKQGVYAWPAIGTGALGSVNNGVLASQSDLETTKPMASINKVLTALVVLQKMPIKNVVDSPKITLTQVDVDFYNQHLAQGGSVFKIEAGQIITLYQALEMMLIVSANNISDSLAVWSYGSIDSFLLAANKFAQENGLNKTNIADPSGFSPSTTSTPTDLVKLGILALKDPVVSSIVSKRAVEIPAIGVLVNTNKLLSDTSVVGIKTGTTNEAGGCLLFAVKFRANTVDEDTFVGVIMGASNKEEVFASSEQLLASAKLSYKETVLLPGTKIVGRIKSAWGQSTNIIAQDELKASLWANVTANANANISKLGTDLNDGEAVGDVSYGKNKVNLVTESEIKKPSTFWRLTHPRL